MCISCRPRVDVHKGKGPAHVDACGQEGGRGQKHDFFVSYNLSVFLCPLFHSFILDISISMSIGVDFGGQPGHVPPIIEKHPCIYHFLPPFPPIFWFAHPIFLTSLRQWPCHQSVSSVVIYM